MDNKSPLVRVIDKRRISDKSLSKPMMIQFIAAYVHHSALMWESSIQVFRAIYCVWD